MKELISAITMVPGYFIAMTWYQKTMVLVPVVYKIACTISIVYHLLLHIRGFHAIALKVDICTQMLCCFVICINHHQVVERNLVLTFLILLYPLNLFEYRQRWVAYTLSACSILVTSGASTATPVWVLAFACFLMNKWRPQVWLHGAFHIISHVAAFILIDK
jgi:hypothetical protein